MMARNHLMQRATLTQFRNDVNTILCLQRMLELQNIGSPLKLSKRSYFAFRHVYLFWSAWNNLNCHSFS
jgi:hypothetical protein